MFNIYITHLTHTGLCSLLGSNLIIYTSKFALNLQLKVVKISFFFNLKNEYA